MSASSSRTKPTPTTNAGIITDTTTGQRHIPSSVRADGSTRKEIRIRPGYRPAEDVEVYKNRTAHAFQTRNTGGVPGAEGLKDDDDDNKKEGGKLNKNAKRREARKKAKAEAEEQGQGEATATSGVTAGDQKPDATPAKNATTQESSLSKEEEERMEKDKKVRKLKKKLREARELQEKKEKGEKLLHEQFEKVIKITELIRDLDKLGFDANGEPKAET